MWKYLGVTGSTKMLPRFRRGGRGKAPFTSHDHEAGPSHQRTPSVTMSTSPQEDWRTYLEPARRSVSLSSSPSYHHSFGPQSQNEPNNSHHSYLPLQRSGSYHAFQDLTPYFQSRFNQANQIEEPMGHNPLGPEDHFPEAQDMEMDDDPDPAEPPSGTPTHPIEISNGSSFHGSPYRGPDSYEASTPQPSSGSHYAPLYEDPHMGGPSNPVSEVDSTPVAPPLVGYDNPIPSYAGVAAYNPFEQPAHTNYNYAEVDPYLIAANYNALHPEGPYGVPHQSGYQAFGYPYPPPPQPPHKQPPQPPLIPPTQQQEILQRLSQVEREVQEERRNH
ncbi:leucine-rich repeat extensin-like protein 5 [Helianthus annuus]|uniref:leucine-rich repeat extensin-like protein 5 n=1 Tax=Helianthus annuus TaxID=4232 RepID=UPI000B908F02|nr:leucine-rich repeat extensin-like protein 5 [Helianthus annuus]